MITVKFTCMSWGAFPERDKAGWTRSEWKMIATDFLHYSYMTPFVPWPFFFFFFLHSPGLGSAQGQKFGSILSHDGAFVHDPWSIRNNLHLHSSQLSTLTYDLCTHHSLPFNKDDATATELKTCFLALFTYRCDAISTLPNCGASFCWIKFSPQFILLIIE